MNVNTDHSENKMNEDRNKAHQSPDLSKVDMHADIAKPTREMELFYEARTKEHIGRVRKCLLFLAQGSEYREELEERAKIHDASKFWPEERIPYIWLTEFHRCRTANEQFEYPDGVEDAVRKAIDHHMENNRHHPRFHDDPNDMSEIDLIEMVCDWTAMAQEHGENGGSAFGWAKKTLGNRLHLNASKERFVYETIEQLDKLLSKNQ